MTQNITYREKFAILKSWLPAILNAVRKDLRNDHLRKDPLFLKQYLAGKNPQKLTNEELVQGYTRAIESEEKGETIAEFIVSRWLLKHSDIYGYFETQLSRINPDFTTIKEISTDTATPMIKEAVSAFGAPDVYLFCELNCVALPSEVMTKLGKEAQTAFAALEKEKQKQEEFKTLDDLKQTYEQQIARLTDRFEKKISGLERKYVNDTESLKKQISNLQKKLSA